MTTRHAGYVVVLEDDIREDDAEATIAALSHIKGVLKVSPVPSGVDMYIGRERERAVWLRRIAALLEERAGLADGEH